MFGRKQDRLSPAREPEEFFEPAGARRGIGFWGILGIAKNIISVLAFVVILYFAFNFIMALNNAFHSIPDIVTAAAEKFGNVVGTAVGSFEGTTVGISEGWETGKEEALTNPETTAEIQNVVRQTGRLEVLQASVDLTNYFTIGTSYESLEIIQGSAVFTVDFADATIFQSGSTIYVYIPEPEMTLYPDYTKVQKIAEKSNFSFTIGKEEGEKAYLNAIADIEKNSSRVIENYDYLVDSARSAAQNQISQLVYTICGDSRPVSVQIR